MGVDMIGNTRNQHWQRPIVSENTDAATHADALLAVISHELLTPLTCVIGWAELAMEETNSPLTRVALEAILRGARREQRLVDDLLCMARLSEGSTTLFLECWDLCLLVEQAVHAAEQAASSAGVTLTLERTEAPLYVQVDVMRLLQAIGHLLHNALKFTPRGEKIQVRCAEEGGRAVLIVRDSGRGFLPETRRSLFERFRQTPRDEALGGLGIGLTLAQGIAELHGGGVEAHSDGPDQGSTFTLWLPPAHHTPLGAAGHPASGTKESDESA